MDVPTLSFFLRPILNVTSVWNTGETGDIHWATKHHEISKQTIYLLKEHSDSRLSKWIVQDHLDQMAVDFHQKQCAAFNKTIKTIYASRIQKVEDFIWKKIYLKNKNYKTGLVKKSKLKMFGLM